MPLIPYVIEKSGREERAMDIYSRLLKDRIVLLGSAVNDEVANSLVAQLLFLQSDDPKADIHLYINSPGGSVTAGLAIYDTMQFVSCDVATYCIGQCASMGAVLLTAGAEGKRHALPNARIMIHQPLAGMEGTAEDIMIHANEFKKTKDRLNRILFNHTGRSLEQIEKDTDRDNFMSAEEALEYRLIDKVISNLGQSKAGLIATASCVPLLATTRQAIHRIVTLHGKVRIARKQAVPATGSSPLASARLDPGAAVFY